MPLTQDNLTTLKRHFEAHEHEFLNDNAYITEAAITDRIEEVDAAWTLEILNKSARQTYGRDTSIVITVRLTINGTSRDGVGMAKVVGKTGEWKDRNKRDKKKPDDWIEYPESDHSEVNEAEKSAATDALKRAARLFGIGRYLLTLPDNVRDYRSMERWLSGQNAHQNNAASPQNRETASNNPHVHNGGKNAQNGHSDGFIENGTTDTAILKALTVVRVDGRNRLKFTTTDNRTVLAFSRKLFQERGWIDENDWSGLGDYPINHHIPVGITHHLITTDEGEIKGGYWEVSSVSEVSFDDTQKAS